MTLSRRRFVQGGLAGLAAAATPTPFWQAALAPRSAQAAGPTDPILVVIQLEGGNDGLGTVIPLDDTGPVPQRSLYEAARPDIGLPLSALLDSEIGADPEKGTALAFHPAMTGLKVLYDQGVLAVLQGVAYSNQNLSHFSSEDMWFSGLSTTGFASGWLGRQLEAHHNPSELVAVSFDGSLNPMFMSPDGANALAIKALGQFKYDDDVLYPDADLRRSTIEAALAASAAGTGLAARIGAAGSALFSKMDDYARIGAFAASHLTDLNYGLARRLREVSRVIRHDLVSNAPVGARTFHCRLGGFDTHSNQQTSASDPMAGQHPILLQQLSVAMTAFWQDMQDLGLDDRVLVVTISEFGRRVAQNGSQGTDHGEASALFVLGGAVQGGVHGTLPALDDLNLGNLKVQTDFRQVYATIIDRWLQAPGAHIPILGGEWELLDFLLDT